MNETRLAVFCADIGSIKKGNFGWSLLCGGRKGSGDSIHELVHEVVACLTAGHKVALGFECPLWVPVPQDPKGLTAGRAVAAGLTETAWILREIRRRLTDEGISPPSAFLDWLEFANANTGLFLWEAFVAGNAKAVDLDAKTDAHATDAMIACQEFVARLPNLVSKSHNKPSHPIRSLIGAAMLWSGWSKDLSLLREKCLIFKPAGTLI